MLNKMNEGFNKLIAYIKNSCKTSGSFMASFGVKLFTSLSLVCLVLAFTIMLAKDQIPFMSKAAEPNQTLLNDPNLLYCDEIDDGDYKFYFADTVYDNDGNDVTGGTITVSNFYENGNTSGTITGHVYKYPDGLALYDGTFNNLRYTQSRNSISSCKKIAASKNKAYISGDCNSAFYNLSNLLEFDGTNFDVSGATIYQKMFGNCTNINKIDVSNWTNENVTDMSYMFSYCRKLTDLNINNFKTAACTNMSYMFNGCEILSSLDVTNFDTHNVTNMTYMFASCKTLQTLDVSSFDTSNVTNMSSMFDACSVLTSLDLSNFNTSNTINMSNMFRGCNAITSIDVTSFDTSNVTSLAYLFSGCIVLTSVDVSGFDTSKVTSMQSTFANCKNLTNVDVSNWNTSKVKNMTSIFDQCEKIRTLDLSNWDTSSVTETMYSFRNCSALEFLDLSSWDLTKVTIYIDNFLLNCSNNLVLKTPKIISINNLGLSGSFSDGNNNNYTQMPITTGTSLTLYKDGVPHLLYMDDNNKYFADGTVTDLDGNTSSVTLENGGIPFDLGSTSGEINAYLYSNGLLIIDGTGDLNSNQTNNLRAKLNETVATTSDSVKKIVASYGGFKPTGTSCKLNYYFSGLSNLEEFYANRMDFSNVQEATNLFDSSFNKNKNNTILDFSHMDLSSCSNISYMFSKAYCEKIDASYLKLISYDISYDNVDCSYLFQNSDYTSSRIKDINMSHWENGNNITNLQYAFVGNPKLEKINFEGTDLGKSGANFTNFFKTGDATVNKTNSTFNIKEIILPKSVGSNSIDISFMTTGLCQFDKAGNKLSDTVQNKLIEQSTSGSGVYKLVGTKKLLASGKISAGILGAIIYNADFYNTGLEYTAYSNVTVAPTVYDLNNDGSLKAYFYSDSNTGGGILLFDGVGTLDKTTMPAYITSHGSDITRIIFSDNGFKPSGDMRYLFSSLGSSTKKISFKEDPLYTINLDKLDLSNVTSMKYLFSNSYFETIELPSMSTNQDCNIEEMFFSAKIYGALDLTNFSFVNKINANNIFNSLSMDSNIANGINIVLPSSLEPYSDTDIDLPDVSSLGNKTWGGYWYSGYIYQLISGAYFNKLIDNTHTYSNKSIAYLKVVDALTFSNLIEGTDFHDALKTLANNSGNNITTITVNHTFKSTVSEIATYLANGGIQVDEEGYTVAVMNGTTVKIYSSADVIYANEDCSNMFRCYVDDDTEIVEDPNLQTITTINLLGQIDTSKTTDFEEMFSGLINLTSLNLSSWDTSKVNDFSRMFKDCNKLSSLTLPSDFVSNKTDYIHTNYMFYGCKALPSIDISGWTGEKYTKIYGMFSGCSSATSITLNKHLISSYIDSALDSDIDQSERRGLESFFRGCTNVTSINLASANGVSEPFDFSNVTNLKGMFSGCENLATLTLPTSNKILTTSVTNTSSMFEDCNSLTNINLSGCDMANVTKMYQMFDGCDSLSTLTLPSHFITNKVTGTDSDDHEEEGLYKLFYHCDKLQLLNLSGSDFSSINNYGYMFYHCDLLDETKVTLPSNGFNSSPYVIKDMFNKSGFTSIDLSNMNLSNLISNQNIINGENIYDEDDNKVKEVILPSQVSSSYSATLSEPAGYAWFGFDASNNKLGNATYKQIPKTGAVTNLAKIKLEKEVLYEEDDVEYYRGGTSDESITLAKYDSNTKDCAWDLSYNKDGSVMAYLYSNGLLILDGTGYINYNNKPWITYGKENSITKIVGSVNKFKPTGNNGDTTPLEKYFSLEASSNGYENKSLTCIDLTNMDFSKVINISYLFSNDTKLSSIIGIESLNVNNITHMNRLFDDCYNLQDLNLSAWNVSGVKYMEGMFRSVGLERTNGTALNLSGWTFSSSNRSDDRAHLAAMFCYAKLSTLNISNWKNFNNTSSFEQMFYYTNITDGVLDFGTVDCAKLDNKNLEGLIVNEIILPPAINSSSYVPLPATQSGKVWMGYDKDGNKVGSTTYTKLVARDGTNAGQLYKVKLTQDILFTIDGVNYKYADLKYTWDISKDMDGSTKAYFFTTNGGTLIFDTIYDSSSNPSDRKLIEFNGFFDDLYYYDELEKGCYFEKDNSYGNWVVSSYMTQVASKLNNENDYRDIDDAIGETSYGDLYFTPWSCLEVCTSYEVKHVLCNKDIYSDSYMYFLNALNNLTGTLELEHFKLNNTYPQDGKTLNFYGMVPYADGLTIKFNNSDINKVYDYAFENMLVDHFSYDPFNYKINIDLRGNDLVNMSSEYDSVMARLYLYPTYVDKIYVPDSLTGFSNYELCYVLFDDEYNEEANVIMLEAYDSNDNFLGYTYHLVDSNNTYDNFTSKVSYLKPNLELSQYAAYMAYFDSSLSDDEKDIMLGDFEYSFIDYNEFAIPSYKDFFKDNTFKDNTTGNDIISKSYFYEVIENLFDSDDDYYLIDELFTNMFNYMNSKLNDNGGLDVTIRADLTDSSSNTNDFYLLNKYANEYLNNLLNSKINVNELSPYYYLDELTLNIKDYLGNALNNLFNSAFNLVRINKKGIEPLKFKVTDGSEFWTNDNVDKIDTDIDYLDDDGFIDPSNLIIVDSENNVKLGTFSDSDDNYYIYEATIPTSTFYAQLGNKGNNNPYFDIVPGVKFDGTDSLNFDVIYEFDFGDGIHFTNQYSVFNLVYITGDDLSETISYDEEDLVGKKTFVIPFRNYNPVVNGDEPNEYRIKMYLEEYEYWTSGVTNYVDKPFKLTVKIPKYNNNLNNIKRFGDDHEAPLVTSFDYGTIVDILSDDYIAQDKNVVRETDSYYVIKNPLLNSTIPGTFIAYDYQDDLIMPFYYATNSGLSAFNDNYHSYDPYDSSSIKTLFDNTSRTLTDSDVENNMKLDYAELSYEFGDDINATATGISYDSSNEFYIAIPKVATYQELTDSTTFNDVLDICGELVYKVLPSFMKGMDLTSYLNSLDTDTLTIDVNELDISSSNVKVTTDAISDKTYTGSAITCDSDVHVYYENNKGNVIELVKGTDYTITGYSNNIDAGLATVTVTGDGVNVTGSRDITFKITRALDLSSVRLLDNALTSNPNLLDKEYDGNANVTSLNNLELTSSDNSSIPSNMKVIVNATYDNSNAGSNKDVTLTYSYVDLSGNSIDTTYYTITDSNVTYKGNISKKKIDVTFNTSNISKTYDKTADINIGITCDASDIISGDTLVLPTSVHGNFARVTASQLDSDIIDISLDSNWYNIDSINSNYELDSSDAPSSISGLINKKEVLYDLTHSLNDTVNVYHYMKTFDGNKDYMLNTILDDTSVIAGDDIGIAPGVYLVSKSSQVGSYHLSDGDVSFDPGVSLFGSDSNNYFIKQPEDTPKFSTCYLEICNKLINDGGSGNINITMPPNPTYTGNEFDIKSQLIIRDNSCYPSYTLVYGSDKDYILKYFDEDGNEISSIKDAGIYSIKVIGQNNYSGEKDLDFYIYKKSISRDDIVLAEKNITKVKDGLDYVPTCFDSDELHLTYTNTLVTPNEVVPIYYDKATFVKDDYSDILYEAYENTELTLRNIKFEDIFIDNDYTNNYEFDYDITSMSNTLFVDNANYLIDNVDPTILDITTEEKTYGRGMPIKFNVTFSEELDGTLLDGLKNDITKLKLIYKIGDNRTYDLPLTNIYNPDVSILSDRRTVLEFSGVIDPNLDLGLPKDQCGEYKVGIDSIYVNDPTKVCDRAGNNANLNSINNILVRNIKPFDINKVKVDTRGFVVDISHVKSERDISDSGYDKSYYHLETDANLVLSGATDNDKDINLLSKLKLTITNVSDDTITKTYTYDDLDFYGALVYTRNELGKDYDIEINLSCLTFHDDDDSDDIEHLGLFRKNDTSGYRIELSIDEDALTNDTGNTNIEAKASNIVIFNAPDFVLDDEDDDFNPNKYFVFVYIDALGTGRFIALVPNDTNDGYKFINALTGEEVYFYQDDKISIFNDLDVSDVFNEFHFDIISDLKGLIEDTLVMNIFGMDAAFNIDYVFSDVTNFLRDNVINNIDNSVYDVISDLYLHYDSMEGFDYFDHFIARNNGIKNIILRVRTIDDITRDVIKVIDDNSKNVLDKDEDYIFINPYAKDFSIIDPNGDIGNYVPDGGAAGALIDVLRELIAHDDNLYLLPEGTFSKELERRNTINPITKDNLKQTLFDIALDSYNGLLNGSKLVACLEKNPLTDSDIEEAMIAYQKMPSWVVKNYLDTNLVANTKTFKYYVDKLFDLYYGAKDPTGAIITPGVIDGYGTKSDVSDNENFEVFGLVNKVDKPNIDDKVFLDVRKITEKDELDSVRSELNSYYVSQSLSFDDKVLTPYDIKLYVKNLSSGNKNYIQPKSGESILVKLELDPLFYYTDFKIYHTTHKDDGTVDEIDSLPLRKDLDLTNNKYYVYFEADSFSTFTITCDAKTIVVSEDGDIDSEGKYLGGSITPNGLIPILDPNVTKTKLFTITLNNDYKAEIYKDFSDSPFMTVNSNKMITLDNLDSDSDNIYLLVKYIYDPKVDPDPVDPEPAPEKPKDLSSATITIQVLSNKKFIDGYKDNTFRPNEYMTRAEFAKVISLLSSNFIYSDRDKDARVATNTYSDIKDTDWYKEYVGYLTDKNILRGYSANNGTKNIYKGNSYIKRSEVSKILTSMFDIKSNDISIINYANEIKGRWYENSVSKLIKAGYLRGYSDGTIKAENYMTRAEVVALINRVVKNDYANINPAQVKGYKDVSKGSWYYNDIITASN